MGITIEEFKHKILQQFRVSALDYKVAPSNIEMLMLDSYKSERRYLAQRTFRCSEFNLLFTVESLDDNGKFQVVFKEDKHDAHGSTDEYLDISDGRQLSRLTYVSESLFFYKSYIHFGIIERNLKVDDYHFSLTYSNTIESTDVKFEFCHYFGPYGVAKFLAACDKYMKQDSETCRYYPYRFIKEDLQYLAKMDWKIPMTRERRKEIKLAFVKGMVEPASGKSPMTSSLHNLDIYFKTLDPNKLQAEFLYKK